MARLHGHRIFFGRDSCGLTGLGVLLSGLQRLRKEGSAISIACDNSVHPADARIKRHRNHRECHVDQSNLVEHFTGVPASDGFHLKRRTAFLSVPLQDRGIGVLAFLSRNAAYGKRLRTPL
jgi:hypothetical protein